jgi:hypothetical protein
MLNLRKILSLKIIPIIMISVFLLDSIGYGFDTYNKEHLRKPLLFNNAVSGDKASKVASSPRLALWFLVPLLFVSTNTSDGYSLLGDNLDSVQGKIIADSAGFRQNLVATNESTATSIQLPIIMNYQEILQLDDQTPRNNKPQLYKIDGPYPIYYVHFNSSHFEVFLDYFSRTIAWHYLSGPKVQLSGVSDKKVNRQDDYNGDGIIDAKDTTSAVLKTFPTIRGMHLTSEEIVETYNAYLDAVGQFKVVFNQKEIELLNELERLGFIKKIDNKYVVLLSASFVIGKWDENMPIRHELNHALFRWEPLFVKGIEQIWNSIDPSDQGAIKGFLTAMGYDIKRGLLLEFSGYARTGYDIIEMQEFGISEETNQRVRQAVRALETNFFPFIRNGEDLEEVEFRFKWDVVRKAIKVYQEGSFKDALKLLQTDDPVYKDIDRDKLIQENCPSLLQLRYYNYAAKLGDDSANEKAWYIRRTFGNRFIGIEEYNDARKAALLLCDFFNSLSKDSFDSGLSDQKSNIFLKKVDIIQDANNNIRVRYNNQEFFVVPNNQKDFKLRKNKGYDLHFINEGEPMETDEATVMITTPDAKFIIHRLKNAKTEKYEYEVRIIHTVASSSLSKLSSGQIGDFDTKSLRSHL